MNKTPPLSYIGILILHFSGLRELTNKGFRWKQGSIPIFLAHDCCAKYYFYFISTSIEHSVYVLFLLHINLYLTRMGISSRPPPPCGPWCPSPPSAPTRPTPRRTWASPSRLWGTITFPSVKIKKFSLLTFGEKFKLRNLDPDPEFLPNLDPDPDPEGYLLPVPIKIIIALEEIFVSWVSESLNSEFFIWIRIRNTDPNPQRSWIRIQLGSGSTTLQFKSREISLNNNLFFVCRSQKMSLSRASEMYGIPPTTLWQRANRMGIPTPKKDTANKNWSEDDLQRSVRVISSAGFRSRSISLWPGLRLQLQLQLQLNNSTY